MSTIQAWKTIRSRSTGLVVLGLAALLPAGAALAGGSGAGLPPAPAGPAGRPAAQRMEANAPASNDAPALPAADAAAQALLEKVLRTYAGYKDFQAHFVETPISRATGEGPSETGIVFYRRPDLWRWQYVSPEKKLVIIRGRVAVITMEGEAEPTRYDLGESGQASGVGFLLSGGTEVSRAFVASLLPSPQPNEEAVLRLRPVRLSDEYDAVTLRIRRKDMAILGVEVLDPGGNSLRFAFSELLPNRSPAESLFDLPRTPASTQP